MLRRMWLTGEDNNPKALKRGRIIAISRWFSLWNSTARHGVHAKWQKSPAMRYCYQYASLNVGSDASFNMWIDGNMVARSPQMLRHIEHCGSSLTARCPPTALFVNEDANKLFFYHDAPIWINRKRGEEITGEHTSAWVVLGMHLWIERDVWHTTNYFLHWDYSVAVTSMNVEMTALVEQVADSHTCIVHMHLIPALILNRTEHICLFSEYGLITYPKVECKF